MTSPGVDLGFHHLGLAVRRPEKETRFLTLLGYRIGDVVFDPLQRTHLILCRHEAMPAVEIIYPGEGEGPLDGLLAGRHELIYHVCYHVESLDGALAALREGGVRVTTVSPPKPAVLFGGRPVSFHMVPGFGLVEILEAATDTATPSGG
jgi:catechol 2,3-dioxygenase-like lactoylglutathione lyase family enzyme